MAYYGKLKEEGLLQDMTIPEIKTAVSMTVREESEAVGYIKEGYAFSPMFTLGYQKKLKDREVFATWLNLERAD